MVSEFGAFTAKARGSIPDQETDPTSCAVWQKKKKKRLNKVIVVV